MDDTTTWIPNLHTIQYAAKTPLDAVTSHRNSSSPPFRVHHIFSIAATPARAKAKTRSQPSSSDFEFDFADLELEEEEVEAEEEEERQREDEIEGDLDDDDAWRYLPFPGGEEVDRLEPRGGALDSILWPEERWAVVPRSVLVY
jgi:hypothetical protein